MKYLQYFGLALLVICIDQTTKLVVHANMIPGTAGEIKIIGDWFKLHYTVNPGMAFGIKLGGEYGKILLTLFRLAAMAGISWYLTRLIQEKAHPGFLVCLSLILGGAIGNVLDSIFYGVAFGLYPPDAPTPWFHGEVIDMIYFHFWEGEVPTWVPGIGGEWTTLWPIFNIADSSIFCGIVAALIFQNKFFPKSSAPVA
jgi:signal peptidase II